MQAREELQSWNWIVIAVDLIVEFFFFFSLSLSKIQTFCSTVYRCPRAPLYMCQSHQLRYRKLKNCSLRSMNTSALSQEEKGH